MAMERINVKKLVMKCDTDYSMFKDNAPFDDNATIACRDDGNWFPDPEIYSCEGKILYTCGLNL